MIICIGAGPGDLGYLTQLGAKLIRVNRTFSDMSIMLIRTLNEMPSQIEPPAV